MLLWTLEFQCSLIWRTSAGIFICCSNYSYHLKWRKFVAFHLVTHFHQISKSGQELLMACSQLEVHINWLWTIIVFPGVHLLRMTTTFAAFGRKYGGYQFLIRLNIFYGMLAVIFFQLKQILCRERCYLMIFERNVC